MHHEVYEFYILKVQAVAHEYSKGTTKYKSLRVYKFYRLLPYTVHVYNCFRPNICMSSYSDDLDKNLTIIFKSKREYKKCHDNELYMHPYREFLWLILYKLYSCQLPWFKG